VTAVAFPQRAAAQPCSAQRSTGPRTAQGKTRSKLNAWRHGLAAVRLPSTGAIDREVEHLSSAIAGPNPDPCREHFARIAAEAELELRRVRAARLSLLAASKPASSAPAESEEQLDASAATLLTLARMDRYEQRALSRRNRALRLL
jgi:hypothetical protein